MNLVKLIQEQLSDDSLGKLSSLLRTDRDTTESAVGAAVPSILAGLSGLASNADGIKKLTGVLSHLDSSNLGNLAQLLSGDTGALAQKGAQLCSSLCGEGMLTSLASAVGRFAGLDVSSAKNLMTYLLPMVLGKIGQQWRNQGGTAGALTNLFTEQKQNILGAMPAGFSLPDMPELTAVRGTARQATEAAETASTSMAAWLLPLAVVLLGGFFLWNMLQNKPKGEVAEKAADKAERITTMKPALPDVPAMPELTQVSTGLTGIFKSFTDTLGGIKDAASAETAAPQLEELSAKLDTIREQLAKLPAAARETTTKLIDEQMGPLKTKAEETLGLTGLSERIKALVNAVLQKLADLKLIQETK